MLPNLFGNIFYEMFQPRPDHRISVQRSFLAHKKWGINSFLLPGKHLALDLCVILKTQLAHLQPNLLMTWFHKTQAGRGGPKFTTYFVHALDACKITCSDLLGFQVWHRHCKLKKKKKLHS